jgi:Probable sensor domain DACNV
MKSQAYTAARTISPKLHNYFACHREIALRRGETQLAPLPEPETIEALIDVAFWASLRREEGFIPRISLAYLPPRTEHSLRLERPLALDPATLTRVAPAVERPGVHLGIWRLEEELCVWGAARGIPPLCFAVEVSAPGLLVVKNHSGEETRKFINVAVLEGDQVKLVEESVSGPGAPPLFKSLIEFDAPGPGNHSTAAIIQLALAMRGHGHGGSLLFVPAGTDAWRSSVIQPMQYAIAPPYPATSAITAAVGGLTAVDGAVVLNTRYEVLGFGAKIVRRKGSPAVEQVILTEPIRGAKPAAVHPDQLGGTRHLSAAQFVNDQHESLALVASQDGRFTVFEWSECEHMVHAHRVEALLL